MARRPTYRDIAERAGVSPTTVSFVLNEREDMAIPAATRERVRRAAAELGYFPNRLARSLAHGSSQTLGVLVSCLEDSFIANIAQGIQDACEERGYSVLLAHTRHRPEVEARQVGLLLEHQVDGLVCVTDEWTLPQTPVWLEPLLQRRTPVVLVDDCSYGDRVDCVVSDDFDGARQVVAHLVASGHRRIAHLHAGERTSSARDRLAGWRSALCEAGLQADPYLVHGKGFAMDDWATRALSLLERPEPPTAIFAASDPVAVAVYQALEERGVRVPGEIALVGYANMEIGRVLRLTSVDQHPQQMGRAAAERLLQRLAEPEMEPETIRVPTRLVVRRST